MAEHHLTTPLDEATMRGLRLGDVLFLTGKLFTVRDWTHETVAKLWEEGRIAEVPFDPRDAAVIHCGPIIRTVRSGEWAPVSVGPTSSSRFSPFVRPMLEGLGPRLIIGKGTLTGEAVAAIAAHGAVFAQGVGGCAALYASKIDRVVNHYWEDYGMIDSVWEFEVTEFGPLSVEIDAAGHSSYEHLRTVVLRENLRAMYREFGIAEDDDYIWWPRVPAGTRGALGYATSL